MYAIIKTGGKQFKVQVGDSIYVEKLALDDGAGIVFDTVLFSDEADDVRIGAPVLADVKVEGKIIRQTKGKKIIVFKFKSKKNYRKKQGHRQPYTQVEIMAINH